MQGHVFKVYQIQTKSVDCMYTGSRAVFCDMVSKDWESIDPVHAGYVKAILSCL